VFDGGYQRFLEKGGWADETDPLRAASEKVDHGESTVKLTKKEKRRIRSAFIADRSKALKPLEQRILSIENRIEKYENELNALNADMMAASQAGDGEKIGAISRSIHRCQSAIDVLFDELEQSTANLEEKKAEFEKKRDHLELGV
jgi:ATP-binding cassette subfamily F protein 3